MLQDRPRAARSDSARRRSAGTTRFTSPMRQASCGVDHGAGEQQLERAALADEPRAAAPCRRSPGRCPSFTSGCPNFAVSLAMRRWQAMASSQPPAEREAVDRGDHRLAAAARAAARPAGPRARAPCRPAAPGRRSRRCPRPATNALGPAPVRSTPRMVGSRSTRAGGVVQLRDDGGVERVELVGPVDGDRGRCRRRRRRAGWCRPWSDSVRGRGWAVTKLIAAERRPRLSLRHDHSHADRLDAGRRGSDARPDPAAGRGDAI